MGGILLDISKPRTLTDYVNKRKAFAPLITSKVFTVPKTHTTNTVDYEVINGNNSISSYISDDALEPNKIEKSYDGEMESFRIPRVWDSLTYTVKELEDINAIGNIYDNDEAQRKAVDENIALEMNELQERTVRLVEKAACELITTGKHIAKDKNKKITYDVGFTAKNFITLDTKWTSAGSDPMRDIKMIQRQMLLNSNLSPTMVILGYDIADILENHSGVKASLDTNNLKVGTIDKTNAYIDGGRIISAGFLGMEWFEYVQQYCEKGTKIQKDLIAPDTCVFICTRVNSNQLHRGPIERMMNGKSVKYAKEYLIETFDNKYKTATEIACETRKIPLIHNPGAFVVVKGIK